MPRHPLIPVPREQAAYDQFRHPEVNDDRHPILAHLHALGRYDYARGFAVRLPLPNP